MQQGRPNTADTYRKWLDECAPPVGTILAISNQPYVLYQQRIGESILPAGFLLETAGFAASPDLPIAVYLDAVARTLWLENLLDKSL